MHWFGAQHKHGIALRRLLGRAAYCGPAYPTLNLTRKVLTMQDNFRKSQLDSKKVRASDNLDSMIGRTFMHTRTQRLFVVSELVWFGDTDEWSVLHNRSGTSTLFVRTLTNFNGKYEDGTPRFVKIKED